MITKNKTSVKYLGVYFIILPLVTFLLFSFTNMKSSLLSESNVIPTKFNVNKSIDENIPSIYPLNYNKVTKESGWGMRMHPLYKINKHHIGYDFALPEGEEIVSTANGIVVKVKLNVKGYGTYLIVKHSDKYTTLYSHLSNIAVNQGDKVEKGQVIGYCGSTGASTEPHLHYEVHQKGNPVDPKDYLPK